MESYMVSDGLTLDLLVQKYECAMLRICEMYLW